MDCFGANIVIHAQYKTDLVHMPALRQSFPVCLPDLFGWKKFRPMSSCVWQDDVTDPHGEERGNTARLEL